jgi:hypothetical protein
MHALTLTPIFGMPSHDEMRNRPACCFLRPPFSLDPRELCATIPVVFSIGEDPVKDSAARLRGRSRRALSRLHTDVNGTTLQRSIACIFSSVCRRRYS